MTVPKTLHRVSWDGDHAAFHCDGDVTSACHNFPECDCEAWDSERHGSHSAVHPDLPHAYQCWQLPWLQASDAADSYWPGTTLNENPRHVNAAIETEWEGESLSWAYADDSLNEPELEAATS